MITIYKSTPEGLQTLKSTSNGCWIKAIDPTEEEISQLEKWGIAPELITYSLDLDEMARVERDDGYTLILLRIPHFQGETHDYSIHHYSNRDYYQRQSYCHYLSP